MWRQTIVLMVGACSGGAGKAPSTTTTTTATETTAEPPRQERPTPPRDAGIAVTPEPTRVWPSGPNPPRDDNMEITGQPRRRAKAPLDGTILVRPALHCGGAMVDTSAKGSGPSPVVTRRVAVVAGDRYDANRIKAAVETASDGTFTAKVPAGRYCIALVPRGPRPADGCYLAEWEACNAIVTVPMMDAININVMTPCWDPCNLPTSAPPSAPSR